MAAGKIDRLNMGQGYFVAILKSENKSFYFYFTFKRKLVPFKTQHVLTETFYTCRSEVDMGYFCNYFTNTLNMLRRQLTPICPSL